MNSLQLIHSSESCFPSQKNVHKSLPTQGIESYFVTTILCCLLLQSVKILKYINVKIYIILHSTVLNLKYI